MNCFPRSGYFRVALVALATAAAPPALAQGREGAIRLAQVAPADLLTRLDRLEEQLRQLTGVVESLQYRNQQLEAQLKRLAESGEPRPPERAAPRPAPAPTGAAEPSPPPPPPPAPGQRRSDAFDPSQAPNAPGVPQALGSPLSASRPPSELPPPGAPGGRGAGVPLDLSTLSAAAAREASLGSDANTGMLPPPPPRNPNATGAGQTVMAPSATPKDEYDLAYGYVLRKDYALAEEAFRAFLKKYPNDRLVADANYWLGESLFQRQRFRDAAESFLTVSTKYESSGKGPEALLRLGESLAALGEKEAACATLSEVGRKFPRAAANVRQSAEREQKRTGC